MAPSGGGLFDGLMKNQGFKRRKAYLSAFPHVSVSGLSRAITGAFNQSAVKMTMTVNEIPCLFHVAA